MIKNIILKAGRSLLDLSTAIDLSLVITLLISLTFLIFASELELNQKILVCCLSALFCFLLFFMVILIKFVIYLLIDIKDNVAKIAGTNEEDNQVFAEFLSVLLTLFFGAIILGLCFSGYMYYNKTILNQKNNFTKVEVNNTIRNKNKYTDKILTDKFGFMWDADAPHLIINGFIPDSAAAHSELKIGDQIVKVNSLDTTNLNVSEVEKEFKKRKLNIEYKRNGIVKKVQLKRAPVYIPNLPPHIVPSLYFNSFKIKNEYALGYFKIPDKNGSYQKQGIICNCNSQNKTITTFWTGLYEHNHLTKEFNYLKDDNLTEDTVYPNTYGYVMWDTVCYMRNKNKK